MKKVLITGGSEGIGLATAKKMSEKGYQVTLVARNKDKLQAAISSIKNNGKEHKMVVADLSKKSEVDALKEIIDQEKFDVFINNAGVGMYGRFAQMPLHDQVQMMNLNMTAVTALSYFYLQQAKRGDVLVNVASTLGISPFPGLSVYSATKAFVTNFSETLWWEYKRKGIYVFAFCPGVTVTNFYGTGKVELEFPTFITQKSGQVANELAKAIDRRSKPRVISGATNRIMIMFHRLISRNFVLGMMGNFSPLSRESN